MKRVSLMLVVLLCAVAVGPHVLLAAEPFAIDIKPGSDTNSLNNDGHGVIPVAILGSATFDVHDIDAGSVELEGLEVAARGKSNKLLAAYEDVNGDGFMDLVLKIEDLDGVLTEGSTTATLTGQFLDGTSFSSTDSISIVPPLQGSEVPTAVDDAYTTDENTTLTVDAPGVLGNDSDPDGDPLSAVLVAGPANGVLALSTDGGFTYEPATDYSGTDSFTYLVTDGTDNSNVATVTLTVESPETMTVFITSSTYTGALGGVSQANSYCQTLAGAAGLEGTYKAWLSDALCSPSDETCFTHSTVPYVRTDGTAIADDWTDLTTCDEVYPYACLQVPICLTESAEPVSEGSCEPGNDQAMRVWTNTEPDGTRLGDSYDCGQWHEESGNGNVGKASFVDSGWTHHSDTVCSSGQHLYCFEQPEPPETKTVFVTSACYDGAHVYGLDGADDICQTHADDPSSLVPAGTYKAWLSTDTESAADRLTHATVPYVRVDGVVVAENWTDLTDGSLLVPINLDETGAEIIYDNTAWTSTQANGTYWDSPEADDDCSDWSLDAWFGGVGLFSAVDSTWSAGNVDHCSQSHRLYCFQQ
jgi:hypothetical protein